MAKRIGPNINHYENMGFRKEEKKIPGETS